MALDPVEQNIQGVQQLVSSKMNKALDGVLEQQEGIEGERKDALDLDLTDEELLQLANKVELEYAPYEEKIKLRQKANLAYYLGRQKTGSPQATDGLTVSDNIIFEATETFIPASLSRTPDPMVFSDDTPEGDALATDTKVMLQYHADVLSLRSQLNLMVRKWLMDLLAVMKHGWDSKIKDITDDVRNVKNFIFDVNGYVDVYGNFVGLLGERIRSTAQELIEDFPKQKEYITDMCDGKLGTEVIRTEWWTDDYTFTTFKSNILEKAKNPNYNYDEENKTTDIDGEEVSETKKGNNHFGRPKKPYTFLSQFSFAEQPHDVTGLIEQNISNQNRITRRTDQIDFNLSRQNNSDIFSGENFNQETATQAKNAILKGNPVLVPSGRPIDEAIVRLEAKGIDSAFFNDLENQKTALRMQFGTEGLTASPPDKNELATGLIQNQQHDIARVTGGMGDRLEAVAKAVFNQHVQFYHVYYTEEHEAKIMGQMRAVEYAKLSSSSFTKGLVVSVAPDSMTPKDEVSEANQAMELAKAELIDPKTLLTRINFPNPQGAAEQAVLWKLNPQGYFQLNFPELAQQMQQIQQQQMQAEQQAQQQQLELQGQAQQQEMQTQGQQAQQGMQIKQAEHEMKMKHADESHKQKLSTKTKTNENKS